jgi:hypothetical protein
LTVFEASLYAGKLLSINSGSGNVDINHCADFTLNGTGHN